MKDKEEKKPSNKVDSWKDELQNEEKYFGVDWLGNCSIYKKKIFINFVLNREKVTMVFGKKWARKLKKELEDLGI